MKRILEKNYRIEQDFDVESLDYTKAKQYVDKMRHLEHTVRECTLIIDYYKHKYTYLKSYNEYFNNIPSRIRNPYVFYNQQLHPNFDVDFVWQLHHRAFQYVLTLPIKQRKGLFLNYQCRMKTNTDDYQMTEVNIRVLETDSKGSIWLVLFSIKKARNDSYTIPYIKIPDNTAVAEKYDLTPQIYELLSKTETNIVHTLFETTNNTEISNKTSKSLNTIKTHFNNIYLKTKLNCNSFCYMSAV